MVAPEVIIEPPEAGTERRLLEQWIGGIWTGSISALNAVVLAQTTLSHKQGPDIVSGLYNIEEFRLILPASSSPVAIGGYCVQTHCYRRLSGLPLSSEASL